MREEQSAAGWAALIAVAVEWLQARRTAVAARRDREERIAKKESIDRNYRRLDLKNQKARLKVEQAKLIKARAEMIDEHYNLRKRGQDWLITKQVLKTERKELEMKQKELEEKEGEEGMIPVRNLVVVHSGYIDRL